MSEGYPRYGRPSASGMARIVACPYSFKAEQGQPDNATEDSKTGDRIHAWLAGQDVELSPEELRTAEMCYEMEQRLAAEWCDGPWPDSESNVQTIREQRLGLTKLGKVIDITPETTVEPIFTGQADVIYVQGDKALVVDYKTLGADVAEAVDNPQLASLAVLVERRYKVRSVRVAIVQPLAGKPTIADFDEAALLAAQRWLELTITRAIVAVPADTHTGPHCLYCKAKLSCRKWLDERDNALEVMNPPQNCGKDSQALWAAMSERAAQIPDAELIARYRGLKMAKAYPEIIVAEMKRRAELVSFPYMLTQPEAGAREITGEPQQVLDAVAKVGVTADAFVKCLKGISVTALQEAVRVASGVTSKEGAKVTKYALSHKDAATVLASTLGPLMGNREAPLELTERKEIEG